MKDSLLFLCVCALFKMGIKCNCKQTERKENRVVGRVFPWRTSLAPTDGSETRGFCMHGRDLASDCQGGACTHIFSFSYTSFGICTHTYTVARASVTQARTHDPMLLSVQSFFPPIPLLGSHCSIKLVTRPSRIVKVTSSSDLEKIRVRSKSTRGQAGRFQRRGLLRTLNKQF